MGMTDRAHHHAATRAEQSDDLAGVERAIRYARAGDLTENEAFEDIERIVHRRLPTEIHRLS